MSGLAEKIHPYAGDSVDGLTPAVVPTLEMMNEKGHVVYRYFLYHSLGQRIYGDTGAECER